MVVVPANGDTVASQSPAVLGTAVPGTTVTVYIDNVAVGTALTDAGGNWMVAPAVTLTNGTHSVRATAADPAGNVSGPSNTNNFTVNVTPPDTSIDSGPTGTVASTSATFTFSSTKPASTFVCKLDGGTFTACSTPLALNTLAQGEHTLLVRAIDAGGNVDPTPATRTWTVDTLAPGAPVVTAPAANATVGTGTPGITGTAEPGSTVTVYLDGAPAGTTTAGSDGTWSFTPTTALADGPHTVAASATDAAGNAGPQSTPQSFTVDSTLAPETTITSGPDASSTSTDATFVVTSTAAGSTFECSLDGAAYAPCPSPLTFTGLAPGAHTLGVRARSAAGVVDPTPATYGWSIVTGATGHFTGGGVGSGVGCSATGGESALALLCVLGLLARAASRRRA